MLVVVWMLRRSSRRAEDAAARVGVEGAEVQVREVIDRISRRVLDLADRVKDGEPAEAARLYEEGSDVFLDLQDDLEAADTRAELEAVWPRIVDADHKLASAEALLEGQPAPPAPAVEPLFPPPVVAPALPRGPGRAGQPGAGTGVGPAAAPGPGLSRVRRQPLAHAGGDRRGDDAGEPPRALGAAAPRADGQRRLRGRLRRPGARAVVAERRQRGRIVAAAWTAAHPHRRTRRRWCRARARHGPPSLGAAIRSNGKEPGMRKLWNYIKAWFGKKTEDAKDPEIEIEQAINEAQSRDRELRNQAAKVVAHRTRTAAELEDAGEEAAKARELAKQALLKADGAARAGNADESARWTQAAQTMAMKIQAADSNVATLTAQLQSAESQAEQAKQAVNQNAMRLQEMTAKRIELLGKLESARMQESVNKAMDQLTATVGDDAPTLKEVEDKIQQRAAMASPRRSCATRRPRARWSSWSTRSTSPRRIARWTSCGASSAWARPRRSARPRSPRRRPPARSRPRRPRRPPSRRRPSPPRSPARCPPRRSRRRSRRRPASASRRPGGGRSTTLHDSCNECLDIASKAESRATTTMSSCPRRSAASSSPTSSARSSRTARGGCSFNPQMRVPALALSGGERLIQSLAIIEYLDEVYPDPPLLPADAEHRAHVRALAQIVACDIHPLNNSGTMAYLRGTLGQTDESINAGTRTGCRESFEAIEHDQAGPTHSAHMSPSPIFASSRRSTTRAASRCRWMTFRKLLAVEAACNKLAAFDKARPEKQPDAE